MTLTPITSSNAAFSRSSGNLVSNVGRYTREDKRADGLYASMRDAFAGHLHADRSETSLLYHNLGRGRFENVTTTSGLTHTAWSGEATAFDADGEPLLFRSGTLHRSAASLG